MTEFITRNHGQKEFEVIIKTDEKEHYKAAQDFARKLIDHAKPQTNADRVRAMSDEELADVIINVWRAEVERGYDIATNWCNSDCCSSEDCAPEKHKACILRWLQKPAEPRANRGLFVAERSGV